MLIGGDREMNIKLGVMFGFCQKMCKAGAEHEGCCGSNFLRT